MSIKDIVDGIGNFFSSFWELTKDLFYQIYTAEYGIPIVIGLIVLGSLIGYFSERLESWARRRRKRKEQKKLDEDKEKPEELEEEELSVDYWEDKEK